MDYKLFIDSSKYHGDLKIEGLREDYLMSGFDGLPNKGDTINFLYNEEPPIPMRARRSLNLELAVTKVNHFASYVPSSDSVEGLAVTRQFGIPIVFADIVKVSKL